MRHRRVNGRYILLVAGFLVAFLVVLFGDEDRDFRIAQDKAPAKTSGNDIPASVIPAKIIQTLPHDPMAFTQGLTIADGYLFESVGLLKRSAIRKVELPSGRILRENPLPEDMFGEGMTIVGKQIIQLTWKSRTGFVYDLETLEQVGSFRFKGKAWGLTFDGQHLILSDGSAILQLLDPATYQVIGQLTVTDQNGPVHNLNELEFVEGEILANVFEKELLISINPKNGQVTGAIDLSALYPSNQRHHDFAVANGIAYDPATERLFVTGKLWPKMFWIEKLRKSGNYLSD